jgi:hypothetical protein
MGYGASSSGYPAYPDVMQVWDDRNETPQHMIPKDGYENRANESVSETEYRHMSYSYAKDKKPPRVETPEESIFWGVRWLYHKAQKFYGRGEEGLAPPYKRWWLSWRDALYNYNSSSAVESYLNDVFSVYRRGVDGEGNILWEEEN